MYAFRFGEGSIVDCLLERAMEMSMDVDMEVDVEMSMDVDMEVDVETDEIGEDYIDFFYESIDAPMYVDFTLPLPEPDDSPAWFCHPIGCTKNHDEDICELPVVARSSKFAEVMAARKKLTNTDKPIEILKRPLEELPKLSKPKLDSFCSATKIIQSHAGVSCVAPTNMSSLGLKAKGKEILKSNFCRSDAKVGGLLKEKATRRKLTSSVKPSESLRRPFAAPSKFSKPTLVSNCSATKIIQTKACVARAAPTYMLPLSLKEKGKEILKTDFCGSNAKVGGFMKEKVAVRTLTSTEKPVEILRSPIPVPSKFSKPKLASICTATKIIQTKARGNEMLNINVCGSNSKEGGSMKEKKDEVKPLVFQGASTNIFVPDVNADIKNFKVSPAPNAKSRYTAANPSSISLLKSKSTKSAIGSQDRGNKKDNAGRKMMTRNEKAENPTTGKFYDLTRAVEGKATSDSGRYLHANGEQSKRVVDATKGSKKSLLKEGMNANKKVIVAKKELNVKQEEKEIAKVYIRRNVTKLGVATSERLTWLKGEEITDKKKTATLDCKQFTRKVIEVKKLAVKGEKKPITKVDGIRKKYLKQSGKEDIKEPIVGSNIN